MPARSASARRYAEAVFDLALEKETIDEWSRDLRTVAAFVAERDVSLVLASNRVPRGEKARLLEAGLKNDVGPLAMNLVRILNDRDKVLQAADIQRFLQELVDAHRGLAHAVVTTAVPLSDDDKKAIAERLSAITGKTVDVTPVVDEAIIGGMVARIGDQLIDGSTRTRLQALKRRLEGAAR